MAPITWDQVGDRVFQTGVDRGVLYLPDNSGVPWNGLVSVTEEFNNEVKSYSQDGVKYLETHVLGDYAAELKAFTYPDEFDEINGVVSSDGIDLHDQNIKSFGLSYRTLVGDDVSGIDRGYKIHILWNLLADPGNVAYETLNDQISPIAFTWHITSIPTFAAGHRPTSHVTIDTIRMAPEALAALEAILYGTDVTDPTLPSLSELLGLVAPPSNSLCVTSTDTPIALSDSTVVTTDITMPVVGTDIIGFVTVAYYLETNWAYDYEVKITHPDSTVVILASRGGGASAVDPIIITPRVGIPDSSWALNHEGGEFRAYPDDLNSLAGKSISGVWTITVTGQGFFPDPPDDVGSLVFLRLCASDDTATFPAESPLVADFTYTLGV